MRIQSDSIRVCGWVMAMVVVVGCDGGEGKVDPEANKKAYESASRMMKEPIGLISVYLPHIAPIDTKDKYAPARHADLDRAATTAATEIRHAANSSRQQLETLRTEVTKELQTALQAVSAACTEAADTTALEKCNGAVTALNDVLQKTDAASTAAGGPKFARIGPESITEEAKKSIAPFLKVKGPGPLEQTYIAKRSDEKVAAPDLLSACQSAVDEADGIYKAFEKGDEPLRLIAVTHKMSLESQCGKMNATDTVVKEVQACAKKAKNPECVLACGKAKAIVEEGVPAAVFIPLAKDREEGCKKHEG